LDGGIKGIFTAAVPKRIEELSKDKITDHFDLICGTSTAGILAIGIGLGRTPAEWLEFYRQRGPVIFRRLGAWSENGGCSVSGRAKFSHDNLRTEMVAILK